MSGTPYTSEDLVYIRGMSICNSAMDKIHAEMRDLRYSQHIAEDQMDRLRAHRWRWFLAALAGWATAAVGWAGLWWATRIP